MMNLLQQWFRKAPPASATGDRRTHRRRVNVLSAMNREGAAERRSGVDRRGKSPILPE